MNVSSHFLDRRGRCVVPMKQCSSHVALKLLGEEVRAECPKLGPIESQLKPIFTLLEGHFASATFREQCNEHEREHGNHDHCRLDTVHALYGGQNITKVAYTEYGHDHGRSGHDECASNCEW